MKTILAVLTFALVAGQSLPDQVKSFVGHIVGGPQAPPGLVVAATPNFGSDPQPGDQVSWVIDVRNAGKAPVYYWLVLQTTSNLLAPIARVNCPPSGSCPTIGQQTFSGDIWATPVTTTAPGAYATITETARILAPGPFSVAVRSGPQPVDPQDLATVGVVVANLPGQTGQPPPAPSNSTDQGPGPSNASNSVAPPSEPAAEQPIRVTKMLAPAGDYQVGEGVTATFTFWNDGDAPQTVAILGNDLGRLRLSDFRNCGPPCSLTVPAHGSSLWSVDGVVTNDPTGRAPSSFSDTLFYRVGRDQSASVTASGRVGSGILIWLVLGGVAVAVVTALGVNNARRNWWRKHINVDADARAGEAAVKPGALPDHVAVRLASGPAEPRGPIPVERSASDG